MAKKSPAAQRLPVVGKRLRTARDQVGVTVSQLAKLASIDQPALSRFERGEKGLESARLLSVLEAAHRIGISLDYVVTGSGSPLRGPIVLSDDPKLVDQLSQLVDALKSREALRDSSG